jgi:hypothetical protein
MFIKLQNKVDGGEQLFHVELDHRVTNPDPLAVWDIHATPVESEKAIHRECGLVFRNREVSPCYAALAGIHRDVVHWYTWGDRSAPVPYSCVPWLNKRFEEGLREKVFTKETLDKLVAGGQIPEVYVLDDSENTGVSVLASAPVSLVLVSMPEIEPGLREGAEFAVDDVKALLDPEFEVLEPCDVRKELSDLVEDLRRRYDNLNWEG